MSYVLPVYTDERHVKQRAATKRWRERNPEKAYTAVRRSIKSRANRAYAIIVEAKSKPCYDCGIQYEPFVMDLDHVRGEKILSVGLMRGYPVAKIRAEIAKCDVVCANCHRRRTHQRKADA